MKRALAALEEEMKEQPKGQSAERMREITRQRMEDAKTDPSKKGGRPRKKKPEELTMEDMLPEALQVLYRQLKSPDERVQQKAALEVLAYVKGKPTQSLKVEGEQVHTIRYESAAWTYGQAEIEEAEYRELPAPAE